VQSLDQYDQQLAGYREAGDAPLPASPLVTAAFRPIPPHKVGVSHLLLKPRFGLFDPTGTGKTPQALVGFAFLRQAAPGFKAIIVARQKSLYQLKAACDRFLVGLRSEIVGYNPDKPSEAWNAVQRQQQYARFLSGEVPILLATRNTLVKDWTAEAPGRRGNYARQWRFDVKALGQFALIIDEIHNIRGHDGRVEHPGLKLISRSARYCWGLTATPLFNNLDDTYAVFELMKPGLLGDFSTFRRDYYVGFTIDVPVRKGSKRTRKVFKQTGYKNLDHLMARLAPYYLQRDDAVFDQYLPEVRIKTVIVDLDKVQRALYDRIIDQHFPKQTGATDYRSARSLAASATKAAGDPDARLEMISALLYAQLAVDAPEVLGVDCPNAKRDELLRFLKEDAVGQQSLIFTRFEQVATILMAALKDAKIPAVRITGVESAAKAREAQLSFQRGDARVCVITSAGGESLDLFAARNVVFYDLPWTFGEFRQVLGRARRQGSAHGSVLLLLLGTTRTIDSKALDLLQKKEKLVAATFSLKDLYLDGESFESRNTHSPVPDTVLRSASIADDTDVLTLFDLMRGAA
jgi:SNF2 family DNA or RNA helicase